MKGASPSYIMRALKWTKRKLSPFHNNVCDTQTFYYPGYNTAEQQEARSKTWTLNCPALVSHSIVVICSHDNTPCIQRLDLPQMTAKCSLLDAQQQLLESIHLVIGRNMLISSAMHEQAQCMLSNQIYADDSRCLPIVPVHVKLKYHTGA